LTDDCPHLISAGSYLLEMLSPEETAEFRLHSARCLQCQQEIVALTPGALFLQELRADILAAEQNQCDAPPLLSTVAARELRWVRDCSTA